MAKSSRDQRGASWLRLGKALFRPTPNRSFRPSLLGATLEGRSLLSSLPSAPTADEQYMLQLINRARANPPAEAQRLLALAKTDPVLKEAVKIADLPAFVRETNAAGSSPPLAFNTRLIAAARDRNAAMLASNDQKHAPGGFLVDPKIGLLAGDNQVYYPVGDSAWATGENLFAYSQNVTSTRLADYVDYFHAGLLIDWGNPDFGHLDNVLAPGPSTASQSGRVPFGEIGIGLLTNANPTTPTPANPANPANRGLNVGPVLVAQEFAWKSGNAFLTGAIFRDGDDDQFYTPGEGLDGITIEALGLEGQGTFSVRTWSSGGYALPLPPGRYSVTASGGSTSPRTVAITIGEDNVGWDVMVAAGAIADQPVAADYDGDGKTDLAVFRASTAEWFIQGTRAGTYRVAFGQPNMDVPVPADYDGDGKADLAVYRPTKGLWQILGTSSSPRTVLHGTPGLDNPAPADYDGDGRADLAVYQPTTGRWSILGSAGAERLFTLGLPGVDVPVPADYNGDGKADPAVYRPTTSEWFLMESGAASRTVAFGQPGTDVPVPGDYDGDGKADLAVYRFTQGQWWIQGTSSPARTVLHGAPGLHVPIPGDYDGDGQTDVVVHQPSTAQWHLIRSRDGGTIIPFGLPGFARLAVAIDTQAVANYGEASARWATSPTPPADPETVAQTTTTTPLTKKQLSRIKLDRIKLARRNRRLLRIRLRDA